MKINSKKYNKFIYLAVCVIFILGIGIILLTDKPEKENFIQEEEPIEMLDISFKINENEDRFIEYDFLNNTKKITIYGESVDEVLKTNFEKETEQKIQDFLRTINFDFSVTNHSDEEEQAFLWSIRVWTEDNLYDADAFIGEGYPPYWNDLMNLIGETDYLQKDIRSIGIN